MSSAIQNSYTRLRDRAEIVAGSFGPTQAMRSVGEFFLVVFFGTLGVMTLLQSRLRLSGKQVLWISLVVGILISPWHLGQTIEKAAKIDR